MTIYGVYTLMIALAAYGAYSDWRRLVIPNAVSLGLLIVFAAHAAMHLDPKTALLHFAVGLAIFAIGAGAFALRLLGGGDVKLLAALALFAGPARVFDLLFVTALAGAGLALLMLSPIGLPGHAAGARELGRRAPMPYALALFAGALFIACKPLTT